MLERRKYFRKRTSRFTALSPLYASTTEYIARYLPLLPIAGSRVLCVIGSADTIFDAALGGASAIDAFDINSRASHWFELKRAALLALSRLEFLEFINPIRTLSRHALEYRVYLTIRSALSYSARTFFDQAYIDAHFSGWKIRASKLFHVRNHGSPALSRYLSNDEEYRNARIAVRSIPIRCVNCSVVELAKVAESLPRYGAIVLSNIADYTRELFPRSDASLSEFVKRVIVPLQSRLQPEGRMCAAYLYCYDSSTPHSEIDIGTRRSVEFSKHGLHPQEHTFLGVREGQRDGVVLIDARSEKEQTA